MTMRHLLVLAALCGGLSSQSNQVPGTDAALATTDALGMYGRTGTLNGLACGVTVCNVGTVLIHWKAVMDPRHPVYAPIVCRETNGRFLQISDRSWVKHGFASINGSACNTCNTSDGTVLGPNCSDTYDAGLNADRYWLGPPEEIDPWLGAWSPVGSYFDRGDPDVGAPRNTDGVRSFSSSMAGALPPTAHRIRVDDADLAVPGSSFWYGQYIVITGEPEGRRDNNAVARQVTPSFVSNAWRFTDVGGDRQGPMLRNWQGATVTSAANGVDNGRFYVGVKVTGPNAQGQWHYEYALHNRDNSRGGASFRIAKCPSVVVSNLGFHDIDRLPATDWTVNVSSTEIAFFAPPSNPQEWNTIYSFWFDADAGPGAGNAQVDQARPGPGAATITIPTDVPGPAYMQILGAGCGVPSATLTPYGTPPRATIPNVTFGLFLNDTPLAASGVMLVSLGTANVPLGNGCTLLLDPATTYTLASFSTTSWGFAIVPAPVPNDPNLEGVSVAFQGILFVPGGPLFGVGSLSAGLLVHIGNSGGVCR